jgi:PHD/YefM family antitoxin component YafN of YafNO toxin-antitoxin module
MGRRPQKRYAAGTKTNVNVTNESRYDSMSTENTVKELEQRANRLDVKIDLGIG